MAQGHTADARRLAHATIIIAPNREEGLRRAQGLAAAALCAEGGPNPCGVCRDCRKLREGIHPDVIYLSRPEDDKGRKKREIGVEQIRALARDALVLPNEARCKVYIIDEADRMNLPAQNAALKLLEEPPGGVIFLLCVQNPAALLPTVRSRCAQLSCTAEARAGDEESLRRARAYLQAAASGSRAELCRCCAGLEAMDSRAAVAFIEALEALLADMLCAREPDGGLGREALRRLLRLAERCAAYLQVNTGVKHIFGLLAVEAIDSDRNRG